MFVAGGFAVTLQPHVQESTKIMPPGDVHDPHRSSSHPANPTDETVVLSQPNDNAPRIPAGALPGYHLVEELHRGGQGVVYHAIQISTRRKVAIKVMREGPFAGPADRARFEREVQILGQLRHPHVVTIHESGIASGHYYFVMEFIEGRGLDEYLAELAPAASSSATPRQLHEALRIFADICDAVHAAHSRQIVHRDLKPSNIRITPDGQPHVLDFGLARDSTVQREANTSQAVTVSGQFMGSLPWSSPEQVEGRSSGIDVRTDVYSLGVILFQIQTGAFPYIVAGNMKAVMDNILNTEPRPPSALRGRIPADLDTITLTCLAKDRERRYASAGDLGRDIRRFLADEPIEAKRDSRFHVFGSRLRGLIRRHPVLSLLAVLPLTLCLAQWVVAPFVADWTPADAVYERWVTRAFAPLAPADGLKLVRVVGVPDFAELETLAREQGLSGVTRDERTSFRRLHGRLMERLTRSGARAVAWDIAFEQPTAYDADFVRGVQALRKVNIPVVVAVPKWWHGPRDLPAIAPAIAREVSCGGVSVSVESVPWQVDLAVQRDTGRALPSLALEAACRARHPEVPAVVLMQPREQTVILRFERADAEHPGVVRSAGPDEILRRVPLASLESAMPEVNLAAGDLVAVQYLLMPTPRQRQAATIAYSDLLKCDSAKLREWLGGKTLILGYVSDAEEISTYADGSSVPRCFMQALAADHVLADLIGPGSGTSFTALPIKVSAVLAGWLIGITLSQGRSRWIALILTTAGAIVAALVAARYYAVLYNPLVTLMAMWIACGLAVKVNRIRRPAVETV